MSDDRQQADVLDLDDVDTGDIELVGGKAANLGALRRIEGVRVPPGFVVTTAAMRRSPTAVPDHVREQIAAALARHGADAAYAVRSSATAEDLGDASFAGQYDSFLGVVGLDAVVEHVVRCWRSLRTERAVDYRRRHGIAEGDVAMAVVVQRLVPADAAGVLFTADPVSGDRTVVEVEAVPGLAEDLVSGRVSPDVYRVRDGDTGPTVVAAPGDHRVVTDAQVLTLARLGRHLEARAGSPQDVEWCLTADGPWVVQARPVTTLFPVPPETDGRRHVYVSVGHQQMMTDAMKALGLSIWQHTTLKPMAEAGNRLFVDVTDQLVSPATRGPLLEVMGRSEPLVRDALETVVAREGFLPPAPPPTPRPTVAAGNVAAGNVAAGTVAPDIELPPLDAAFVAGLVARSRTALADLAAELEPLTGPALFDALRVEFDRARRVLFDPASMRAIHAGLDTADRLGDQLDAWLGERRALDVLTRSVDHNVTSEMGLALLEVADVVRPHPAVVAALEQVAGLDDPDVLAALDDIPDGAGSRAAIEGFLDRYGMRCAGEIDVTRPRWSDRPGLLLPVLLADVAGAAPGDGPARFARGRVEALAARDELARRIRSRPGGAAAAEEFLAAVDRLRLLTGYREYPKFDKICRTALYRRALTREAERLVAAGTLREVDDAFHLRFTEFETASRTGTADLDLVDRRRREFAVATTLRPSRVLTSDGEGLDGRYHRDDLPPGALPGLAVSAGVVAGRARVVADPAGAVLEPGDVLVTRFTDPGWTPLFVVAAALVTEVGGLMTHGAVIAREYGLPAVVGVTGATTVIPDGARVRVDGTAGLVEVLG